MYFNEIKNHFKANPNTINPILKSLVASGLIAKKVRRLEDIGDGGKIYYKTTSLGEKFLSAMYNIILPPLDQEKMTIIINDERLTLPWIDNSKEIFQEIIEGQPHENVIKIEQIPSQKAEIYSDQSYRPPIRV